MKLLRHLHNIPLSFLCITRVTIHSLYSFTIIYRRWMYSDVLIYDMIFGPDALKLLQPLSYLIDDFQDAV